MISHAFMPMTPTVSLSVGTASAGVAMPSEALYCETVRIFNDGANTVFLEISSAAAAPTATAAASLPMPSNSVEVFTFARPTFVAAVAGAPGNTLRITAGAGV